LPPTVVTDPESAEEVYDLAARPRPEQIIGRGHGTELDRAGLLGEVFNNLDPGGADWIDLDRFGKLFENFDEEDEGNLATKLFLQIDAVEVLDGKITRSEFITWHTKNFSKLNDETFAKAAMCLAEKAKTGQRRSQTESFKRPATPPGGAPPTVRMESVRGRDLDPHQASRKMSKFSFMTSYQSKGVAATDMFR